MSHFFAYLSRMRLIQRWSLMFNIHQENVQEHSLQVCTIAHMLALISNKLYEGTANPERVAMLARSLYLKTKIINGFSKFNKETTFH